MDKRKSEELTLKVPWGHIAARTWGNQQHQPVLLLHGIMDNADSFTRLIQLLPDNYYYVAADLPGHGLSSHFPSGMALEPLNYILTVHYILEELKWQKCLFIGHSFGAAIAVMFDAVFHDRFEKIVAIDAISGRNFSPDDIPQRWRQVCTLAIETGKKQKKTSYTREQILDRFQHKRTFKLNRDAAEALFDRSTAKVGNQYVYNTDERSKAYVMPCLNFDQYRAFFRQQRAPVLFIVAKESWYHYLKQSETVDSIERYFSDKFSIVKVEGSHDVHNNNPERIAPLIIKFFNDQKAKL